MLIMKMDGYVFIVAESGNAVFIRALGSGEVHNQTANDAPQHRTINCMFALAAAIVTLLIWVYLVLFHGGFWRTGRHTHCQSFRGEQPDRFYRLGQE